MADTKEEKEVVIPKNAADVQRIKLEKLMKNPQKPVVIPDKPEDKLPRVFRPPEFIRNIWGSSAGAGSGDFHVYRGIRRREYARQKCINEKAEKDGLDEAYHKKVVENEKQAEERTAKKRAKRLKKKHKQKQNAKKQKVDQKKEIKSESEEEESEDEAEPAEASVPEARTDEVDTCNDRSEQLPEEANKSNEDENEGRKYRRKKSDSDSEDEKS